MDHEPYGKLKYEGIKGETQSTIVADQDQTVSANYFKNNILKKETDSKYRLCKQEEESSDDKLRVLRYGEECLRNETR